MQKKKKVVKKVVKKVSKKSPKLSAQIIVRLTEKEYKVIIRMAKKLKMSRAAVIRSFVGEGIANHQ